MNFGIIGGGAAGLAAAYELSRRGHTADVFETAPILGGQASTFTIGGGQLERGYHHLFRSDRDMVQLIREVGLEEHMGWFESKVGLFHGGRVWPFSSPLDLLRFSPLSFGQRLRVGFWTFLLQNTRNWRKFEDVTARDWIIGHMGDDAYRVIWEPLLRGKFGDSYNQIGMAWLWSKFRLRVASRGKAWQKERLGYPLCSFGDVFDAVARRIHEQGGRVHTGTTVEHVEVSNGRAAGLTFSSAEFFRETRQYDAVIATTPSYIFPSLVDGLPADYVDQLRSARYLSAVLIILALNEPLSDVYWMNIADRTTPFLGIIEHTNMIDPGLYGGHHIVYITNYLSRDDPMYDLSPGELLAEYLPHLRRINPGFDLGWIVEFHYHKVDGAQPIIGTHYGSEIPDHRTPIRNLYLANTTQIYPEDRGTNYSVRMGRQVARLALDDLA